MAASKEEFFREITLKICGTLDSEKALWQSLMYLQRFMPVVRITFHIYTPESGAIETIAYANPGSSVVLSVKTAVTGDVLEAIQSLLATREVHIVDSVGKHPLMGPVARDLRQPEAACMVMALPLDEEFTGFLAVSAGPETVFTTEHAGLLSTTREAFAIALANCLRYREVISLKEKLEDESRYYREELRRTSGEEIVGIDQGLRGVMDMVQQVAPMGSPVLLLGETGVGKELIANAIHFGSGRGQGPFIKVNCGAIPESLMDSELFGHEKGAFTGAVALKRGRFERANGGTIFLDEIGELPPEVQVRLLRVLQEKTIERIGGMEAIPLDLRVIAATHRNLETMIREGTFRDDLFFRLSVFPIPIPPLRERRMDIPSLVNHFMYKKSREMGLRDIPVLSEAAIGQLLAYEWPGNVRELENAVERELILSRGKPLDFTGLTCKEVSSPVDNGCSPPEGSLVLDDVIAAHIRKVLILCSGRIEGAGGASEMLAVNPGTLRHRLRKLNIPFGRKVAAGG